MIDFTPREEELHPELERYHTSHETLGAVIQHPLVYSVPHSPAINWCMNDMLAQKKRHVADALKEKDYSRFINLHEKPWRLHAFEQIMSRVVDPEEFWKLLTGVWVGSENIQQNYEIWLGLWKSPHWALEFTTELSDLRAFSSLPETLTIYRGMSREQDADGLSWTLDEHEARWFAGRYERGEPYLATATIAKANVRAFITHRNETEIVALPEHVDLVSVKCLRRAPKRRTTSTLKAAESLTTKQANADSGI